MMRAGGGKSAGGSYERRICKRLSLWLSNDKRDDLLWRSAMSGGRATVRSKQGGSTNAQVGDISSIDPASADFISVFAIELKHVRKLGIANFFLDNTGTLRKFWKKIKQEALSCNKRPMLIGRQKGIATDILLVDKRTHLWAYAHGEGILPRLQKPNVYGYQLAEFLERVPPKHFAELRFKLAPSGNEKNRGPGTEK